MSATKNLSLRIEHILDAIGRIQQYTSGLTIPTASRWPTILRTDFFHTTPQDISIRTEVVVYGFLQRPYGDQMIPSRFTGF